MENINVFIISLIRNIQKFLIHTLHQNKVSRVSWVVVLFFYYGLNKVANKILGIFNNSTIDIASYSINKNLISKLLTLVKNNYKHSLKPYYIIFPQILLIILNNQIVFFRIIQFPKYRMNEKQENVYFQDWHK